MRKILVTGAGGFIGSHVTEALIRAGRDVRAFVRYNGRNGWGRLDGLPDDVRDALDVYEGDVADIDDVRAAMKGCDGVLHLAALISVPHSYRAPGSYVDANIRGTLNVLTAARDLETPRVIHTSTSEVYGTAQTERIAETHPLNAQSPYAASKIGADQMALAFHRSFGTPVTIVRPFNTFGPRQSARAVIPAAIIQATAGARRIRLGNLDSRRDFLFVEDTAAGFLAALDSDAGIGRVINLGTGVDVSIRETVELIGEALGVSLEATSDPARLRPPDSEVDRLCADVEQARMLLGWRPAFAGRDGFRQALARTAAWFADPVNAAGYRPQRYSL
jgi:NAD dependent epimerase/dehydratase